MARACDGVPTVGMLDRGNRLGAMQPRGDTCLDPEIEAEPECSVRLRRNEETAGQGRACTDIWKRKPVAAARICSGPDAGSSGADER